MNNIKAMGIDYSANFTGVVYTNIIGDRDFWFTSNLKRDKDNTHCTFLNKELKTLEKVDIICDNIFGLINEVQPQVVAMESPAFMASNQNADFQDGYGIIKYVLRTMGIPYILIPPISLKLFACGNARAEKLEVADGIEQTYDVIYSGETTHWDNLYDAHTLYEIAKLYINQENISTVDLSKQQVMYGLLGNTKMLNEVKKLRSKTKRR